MTYKNQIDEMISQYPDFFDYYRIYRDMGTEFIFDHPQRIIRDTFLYASKQLLAPSMIADSNLMQSTITDARAAHSISSLFLGALIAHRLLDGRFSSLSTDIESKTVYKFSYIWTLTCLYHDYGYYYENDHALTQLLANEVNSAWKRNTVESRAQKSPFWLGMAKFRENTKLDQSIWRSHNYTYDPTRRLLLNEVSCKERYAILQIEEYYRRSRKCVYFVNQPKPIYFPIRKSNDINRYFAYRLLSLDTPVATRSRIDHGIAGGCLFFDRIIRNYAKAFCVAQKENPDTDISDFTNPNDYSAKPMHFSFSQITLFAYIADCIINHNIWSAKPKSEYANIYKRMGMVELLTPKYNRVNFMRNPLLFILAVSDSIEPYKLFSHPQIDTVGYEKGQLNEILLNTNIDVDANRIRIEPPKYMIDKLENRLKDMKDWIDIDFDRNGEGFEIIPRLI